MKNTCLVEAYLEKMEPVTNKNTFAMYSIYVREFFYDFMKMNPVTEENIQFITIDDANEWAFQMKEEYANASVNLRMTAMNWFFNLMVQDGICKYSPFNTSFGSIRLKVKDYSSGRRMADKELRDLNEYFASNETIKGLRDRILFLILATTGIRRDEARTLTIGAFTVLEPDFIINYKGKGDKPLFVKIPWGIKPLLDEYLERRNWNWTMTDQYVFSSTQANYAPTKPINDTLMCRIFQKAFKACGINPNTTIHDFRHTYITKSLDEGIDLLTVSKRVGHSDIAITQRYDHSRRILKDNPNDDFFNEITSTSKNRHNHPDYLRLVN